MLANDYVELIKVVQRYCKLYTAKNGQLKTTFEHGRIAFEIPRNTTYEGQYVIRSKHGIVIVIEPHSDDPDHWSKGGTLMGKTTLTTWANNNNLVLNNNVPECTVMNDFVIGSTYSSEGEVYKVLPQVQCLDDLEGIIFQQSLIHECSEEYGLACLHASGLIELDYLSFGIRKVSHLGSTEKTLLGIRDELKEYLKYVR